MSPRREKPLLVLFPSLFLIFRESELLNNGDNAEEAFAEYCTRRTQNRVWHSYQYKVHIGNIFGYESHMVSLAFKAISRRGSEHVKVTVPRTYALMLNFSPV